MTRKVFVILVISLYFSFPYLCHAFYYNSTLEGLDKVAVDSGYSIQTNQYSMSIFVGTVISSLLSLLGIIFIVLMLYGGFKWMKATGREDEVGKAQDIIRQAIIGLIITASSYAIYSFVMSGLLG